MAHEDLERMPYADLWLAELGGTVPELRAGEEVRRRRRGAQLLDEDLATRGAAPYPTRPDGRA